MPPTCQVCLHPQLRELNRDLILGASSRRIAKRYGPSSAAILRHRQCIAEQLEAAKVQSGLMARDVLIELVLELREMAADVKRERAGKTPNAWRRMFLEVADRLNRAADSFARVNREVMTSLSQFLAECGVRDEAEARALFDAARSGEQTTLDDCEADGVELLRMVLSQRPERRVQILSALGGQSAEPPLELGDGTNGSIAANGSR